jgi:hypothetical protein
LLIFDCINSWKTPKRAITRITMVIINQLFEFIIRCCSIMNQNDIRPGTKVEPFPLSLLPAFLLPQTIYKQQRQVIN